MSDFDTMRGGVELHTADCSAFTGCQCGADRGNGERADILAALARLESAHTSLVEERDRLRIVEDERDKLRAEQQDFRRRLGEGRMRDGAVIRALAAAARYLCGDQGDREKEADMVREAINCATRAHDGMRLELAEARLERDRLREAARLDREAMEVAWKQCVCHGRGIRTTSCTLCGDSTYDHACNDKDVPCEFCVLLRSRLAATPPAPAEAQEARGSAHDRGCGKCGSDPSEGEGCVCGQPGRVPASSPSAPPPPQPEASKPVIDLGGASYDHGSTYARLEDDGSLYLSFSDGSHTLSPSEVAGLSRLLPLPPEVAAVLRAARALHEARLDTSGSMVAHDAVLDAVNAVSAAVRLLPPSVLAALAGKDTP